MTDKAKLKGLRPLSLTHPLSHAVTPLAALLPVTGAGNRIYRAEEATAPAEAQTLLLLSPAAESTPAVVLAPQPVPVIPPPGLSTDKAEPQSAVLPALGPLLAPPTGLLYALPINPPDKGSRGTKETLPEQHRDFTELHRAFSELHRGLSESHPGISEPLALLALASETQQRPYEVAFQTGTTPLDLNQDDVINPQDAQALYYLALFQASTLTQAALTPLLNNLHETDPSPERLNALRGLVLSDTISDLNDDNVIDLQDVRVLYYALRFEDILRASPSLRETLLSDLTTEDDAPGADRDGVYLAILDRVAVLLRPALGNIDLTRLSAGEGFIIQGDVGSDNAGRSVSNAGDVNGDGYADLIVGAPFGGDLDDGTIDAGEAYIVFGNAPGPSDPFGREVINRVAGEGNFPRQVVDLTRLAAGRGFIIQGDEGGRYEYNEGTVGANYAGSSVSGAGDVNGDGFADLIVGAPGGADGGTNAGEAYVVFGKASGFGREVINRVAGEGNFPRQVVDLTSLVVGDGFIIQGDVGSDNAGVSVSGAGDVNGDGFADLIVGANQGDDGGSNAGEAYVVFGKASGFGSLDSDTNRRVVDLTSLAAGDGFIIQGDAGSDNAGVSVSGAGDVNGDGFADLIVGANQGDDGESNAGEAYVVFGKASGFGSLDSDTNRQVVDLTSLAAGDGFIIQGDMVMDQAGVSVSGAGDVNGDGYADLIVGANQGDDGEFNAGEAYVVFGKASGPSDPFGSEVINRVADDEGNFFNFPRQVVDLTSLAAGDGFIIQGDLGSDNAGVSVSGAGDVNGDGYADLIVGANGGDDGGGTAGEAYVVFGKASGFGSLDSDTNRQVVDLTGLAAGDGFIIQGDMIGDNAGVSVSAAGDVNGDGFADLIVGANQGDDGEFNAGEAYVLFGGPAGLSTEAAAVLGTDDNDVLNVNGEATVVLAGAGNDVLTIDGFGDTDLLRFDGGTGTDTLSLANPDADTDLSLDLRTLADTRLSSIEHIDLSGSGDNILTLTRLDLLNLSEVRTNGRAELRVDGNTGDSVTTDDDGWVQQADDTIEGTTYRVFDNGNARLLVNIEVSPGGNLMATSRATMAEVLQKYATSHTVDIRAFIDALPPEDEEQKRKRLDDELAMLGPLPAAKQAMELTEPTAVAEPDADLFDLPPLIPDES